MDPSAEILLVDLPFASACRPNIALASICSSARAEGYRCSVWHAKLALARAIGHDLYRAISEQFPSEFLVGDILFASSLRDVASDEILDAFREQHQSRRPHSRAMPDWAWPKLRVVAHQVENFVESTAELIARSACDFIGFGATFQLAPSLAIARRVKQRCPSKKIVLGGAYCEGEMGEAIAQSFDFVDFVVRGEGEDALLRLLAATRPNRVKRKSLPPALETIPALVWRSESIVVVNPGTYGENQRSMNEIPAPTYDDWFHDLAAHPDNIPKERTALLLESSRGCWYGEKVHCVFCGLTGDSLKFRSKSPDVVLREVDVLAGHGVKNVDAVDLILANNYFTDLLPRLRKYSGRLSFFYEVKANLVRWQVQALSDAGVRTIQPGIEGLDTTILAAMKKGVKAYQNVRLLKWCGELGIRANWNLLYRLPGETESGYDRTCWLIPFLHHLQPPDGGCVSVLLNRFSPMFKDPGRSGIASLQPVPAYPLALGDVPTDRLAYFFDHECDELPDAYRHLEAAVAEWNEQFLRAAHVTFDDGEELLVVDTRLVSSAEERIVRGSHRAVYLACDDGPHLDQVSERTGLRAPHVATILDELVEQRLLIKLDDRFLSLAVPMERHLGASSPPRFLLGVVLKQLYLERQRIVWASEISTQPIS